MSEKHEHDLEPEFDFGPIIEVLAKYDLGDPAVLRIVRTPKDEDGDQGHVLQGNQRGLQHAAAALIRASIEDVDDYSCPPVDEVLFDLFDEKSDIVLDDVVRLDAPDIAGDESKRTFGGTLGNFGCVAVLITIPVFWVIGLYTIYLWIFG